MAFLLRYEATHTPNYGTGVIAVGYTTISRLQLIHNMET